MCLQNNPRHAKLVNLPKRLDASKRSKTSFERFCRRRSKPCKMLIVQVFDVQKPQISSQPLTTAETAAVQLQTSIETWTIYGTKSEAYQMPFLPQRQNRSWSKGMHDLLRVNILRISACVGFVDRNRHCFRGRDSCFCCLQC